MAPRGACAGLSGALCLPRGPVPRLLSWLRGASVQQCSLIAHTRGRVRSCVPENALVPAGLHRAVLSTWGLTSERTRDCRQELRCKQQLAPCQVCLVTRESCPPAP